MPLHSQPAEVPAAGVVLYTISRMADLLHLVLCSTRYPHLQHTASFSERLLCFLLSML